MSSIDLTRRIGDRVKTLRTKAGLSRRALAEAARVSERYLVQLEGGEANISIGVLSKVANALSEDLINLLGGGAPATLMLAADDAFAAVVAGMQPRERDEAAEVLKHWLNERRRRLKGVALLGLRGAGKTTIGKALSIQSGLPVVSITREIESRAGMSLAELFNLGGTDAYRTLENDVIDALITRPDPVILETAGGIVGNRQSLDRIFAHFRSVWLKATPEDHLDRVAKQGDLRPMSGNPKALEHLKSLLAQREPEYARADILIDTSGRSIEACVEVLIDKLGWRNAA